ncbi:iron-sulfur cluster-binding domain-containing protein [Brevibacterium album]|uniref:iron-sulfur cluster-binding domain-containing protein n=1 Tax=Brevibacterium album TaxID=417948 RepID=UPI00040D2D2A|nr:iron-sulfur cluster-binding domain-containing protein [Brevibacterium album]
MTVSTTMMAIPTAERIRGLEMPWNRVLGGLAADGAALALGPWQPQEFTAECVETRPEAGRMLSCVFRRTDGLPLTFRAGQYLNIAFPVHGPDAEPVERSYSLSSSPTEPWTFTLTVKREEGGLVSRWIHEHLHPGTVLEVLGPVGAFHLPDADSRARYLLLAAGSGITPLMSMVRAIRSLPGQADVVMLYHGTEPGAFAFGSELEHCAYMDSRIDVYYSLGDRRISGTWEGMAGRLTADMIREVAPDAAEREVFACGPGGYLDAAGALLREIGVDDARVHMEFFTGGARTRAEYRKEIAWASEFAGDAAEAAARDGNWQPAPEVYGPEAEVPAPCGLGAPLVGTDRTGSGDDATRRDGGDGSAGVADRAVQGGAAKPAGGAGSGEDAARTDGAGPADGFETVGEGSLTMTFTRTRRNVRVDPGQTVLEAALAAGVPIGANCEEGMCGTCKSVKVSGEVDMHHQGGIRAREIKAGKFLPCCSTPLTDLVIEA